MDENVSFSDYSIKKRDENEKLYEIASTIEGLDDYEYAAIVDVTYKGVRYAFGTDISYSGKLGSFRTFEELDLSELTIDSIKAYRSYGKRYNWFKETGERPIYLVDVISLPYCPCRFYRACYFGFVPRDFSQKERKQEQIEANKTKRKRSRRLSLLFCADRHMR